MDKENLVIKSNELNAINYFDSSVQLKIFSKLIVEIMKQPDELIYRLPIKDVLTSIGAHDKDYAALKKAAKSMFKVLDIPKQDGFHLTTLFLDIKTSRSLLEFEVNPKLKPHILGLRKNFTQYFFANVAKLNSRFSIRIYELLKQFQQKDLTGWIELSLLDIRDFLGIKPEEYKKYFNIKNKVILVSQKELSAKTDIKFEFEEIKEGRKVVKILFKISPNKEVATTKQLEATIAKITSRDKQNSDDTLKALLQLKEVPFLITDSEELTVLLRIANKTRMTKEQIENSIYAVREYIDNKSIKTSVFAMLKSSLIGKWKPSVSVAKRKQQQRQHEIDVVQNCIDKLTHKRNKILTGFDEQLLEKARVLFRKLPTEEQQQRTQEFQQELTIEKTGRLGSIVMKNYAERLAIKEFSKEQFDKDKLKLFKQFLSSKKITLQEWENIEVEIKSLQDERKKLEK